MQSHKETIRDRNISFYLFFTIKNINEINIKLQCFKWLYLYMKRCKLSSRLFFGG